MNLSELNAAVESFTPPPMKEGNGYAEERPRLVDTPMLKLAPGTTSYKAAFLGYWAWVICGRIFAVAFRVGQDDTQEVVHRKMEASFQELVDYVGKSLDKVREMEEFERRRQRPGPALIRDGEAFPPPSMEVS